MNAKELETQHNLKKWAAIIKECRSSGMKILQWLEINNISKDQYYYWQRKLNEICIDTLERQAATFVELPVTKEVPISTEFWKIFFHCHQSCQNISENKKTVVSGLLKVKVHQLDCLRLKYLNYKKKRGAVMSMYAYTGIGRIENKKITINKVKESKEKADKENIPHTIK